MALTAGTRLGHYDVTALLGEGGMGEAPVRTRGWSWCRTGTKELLERVPRSVAVP